MGAGCAEGAEDGLVALVVLVDAMGESVTLAAAPGVTDADAEGATTIAAALEGDWATCRGGASSLTTANTPTLPPRITATTTPRNTPREPRFDPGDAEVTNGAEVSAAAGRGVSAPAPAGGPGGLEGSAIAGPSE